MGKNAVGAHFYVFSVYLLVPRASRAVFHSVKRTETKKTVDLFDFPVAWIILAGAVLEKSV